MTLDYLASLQSDMAALAAAGRTGPLDANVPHCPGWDLARLIGHLGRVYSMATIAVRSGSTEQSSQAPDRPPTDGDLVAWFDERARALLDALASTPIDAPAWNFTLAPRTAGFWERRQAHETAIHRWDAQSAIGIAESIDPALAVDGVDEVLSVLAPARLADAADVAVDLGGTLHLHATDAEGEWMIATRDGALVVDHGHGKGDVAVRGPASSLLLMLWHRLAPDDASLQRFGDESVLARWHELKVTG